MYVSQHNVDEIHLKTLYIVAKKHTPSIIIMYGF